MNRNFYPYSRNDAEFMGQMDRWRESHYDNMVCVDYANSTATGLTAAHDGYHLNKEYGRKLIEQFGLWRVIKVVAYSVNQKSYDGRIAVKVKEWAKTQAKYGEGEALKDCVIDGNAGLLDILAKQVMEYHKSLNLFDKTYCTNEQEYKGKVLIMRDDVLTEEYCKPESQLWYATGGFGCGANSRGRAVFVKCLSDGEETRFDREDFVGVIKNECLPDWAKDALKKIKRKEQDNER